MAATAREEAEKAWRDDIAPWLEEKESERRAAVKKLWRGLGIGAAIGLLLLVGFAAFEIGFGVLGFVFAVVIGGAFGGQDLNNLRKEIKTQLLNRLAAAFGLSYALKPDEPARFEAFREHGLLPSYNRKAFEDHFSGKLHGADFELYEAHLEQRRRSKNNTYYVTVFRGVLIRLNFPRTVTGVTVITRDRGWFNGLEAFARSFGGVRLQRIGLVDPKFQSIFEVYGTDQVMARYLLTPSFMERLLELEAALKGKNVRAAFDERLGEGELLIAAETGNLFEPGSMFQPLNDRARFDGLIRDIALMTEIIDLLIRPAEFGEAEAPV